MTFWGAITILCFLFFKLPVIKEIYNDTPTLLTAFFGLFIFIDIFNSFNSRTNRLNIFSNIKRNKVFIFVILFIIIVQILMIYYGGNIFRTNGLTLKQLIFTILYASMVIPFDVFRKVILKRKNINTGV